MSDADLLTLLLFLGGVLVCLAALTAVDLWRQRTAGRMQERLRQMVGKSDNARRDRTLANLAQARNELRRRRRREAMGSLGYYLNRLDTAQRSGSRWVAAAMAASLLPALGNWMFGLLALPWWAWLLGAMLIPLWAGAAVYRLLLARFEHAFVLQLPEAIDLIVSASQAGVPPNEAIMAVADQLPAPAGPEFRRIADGLMLGNDMSDVLDEASLRISVAEFSFLTVCLSLQRSTGGSLAEALGNLADTIRARRDLMLKTRALTAESRLSGNVLAVLPFVVVALLYWSSPDYIGILFTSQIGHLLLAVAGVMLFIGVLAMRRLGRLKV